ncbi:MAG: hypothetical protein GY781_17715 [Gammaproteobacteria bacterium]|nr:hypothetical protein [Gammaproteobacteria bacterium]
MFRQTGVHNWTDLFKHVKSALLEKINNPETLTTERNEYALQYDGNKS